MRFRAVLLGGVTAGTLLAGAVGAVADDFLWIAPDSQNWEALEYWAVDGIAAVRLPEIGDLVQVSGGGTADLYGEHSADTLDLGGGTVWVNSGAVLNLEALNISGDGMLALSRAKPLHGLEAGTVNVSGDVILSGGQIARAGHVQVGAGGVFTQSGGEVIDQVTVDAPTYVQTGGRMAATVTADTYEQSGGTMGGTVTAGTYSLTGAGALSGTIDASQLFRLNPDGNVTVDAYLTGTGELVKSGDATVTLAKEGNDFTGDIRVEAGMLEITEGAHARTGNVTIAGGAVLRSIGGSDTNFRAAMTGEGWFEQASGGQFGVGEGVELGGVKVTSGTFRVGTAYFDTGDGTGYGNSAAAHFGTVQLGGVVPEADGDGHVNDVDGLGVIEIERGSALTADLVEVTAGSLSNAPTDSLELPAGIVHSGTFRQSGGRVADIVIDTATYDYSGGELLADVSFSELFRLSGDGNVTTTLTGDGDAAVEQSGGRMAGNVTGVTTYTQSGGEMASHLDGLERYTQSGGTIEGSVGTLVYELAGGSGEDFDKVTIGNELVLSGGTLARDNLVLPVFTQSGGAFTGDITVGSYNLTGTDGTFTGVIDASKTFNLAPASGATTLDAQLTGTGKLVKDGNSTVTLSNAGNDFTGTVAINAGVLEVIDDALPEAAAVTIGKDAALQLTTNADTLFTGSMTGREGDLIKSGGGTATLSGAIDLGDLWLEAGRINIGTGTSTNEAVFESATIAADSTLYIASGAMLTIRVPKHIINNGTLINDGTVHDDLDNNGEFANNETYNADVASNTGTINNNTPGQWTGDVLTNGSWINNNDGATWTGDIVRNAGRVANNGGTWRGDVVANSGDVINDNKADETGTGYWYGDVVSNDHEIFNGGGGVWEGDVLANNSYISNGALGVWTGDIHSNDFAIWNGGTWTGDIYGNNSSIQNNGVWTGDVLANGGGSNPIPYVNNYGIWNGNVVSNRGAVNNQDGGAWIGDVEGVESQIRNLDGGTWVGNVKSNNNAIFNEGDAVWTGDVITNGGGSNPLAIVTNEARWVGDVRSNAATIYNEGSWTGHVLANTGAIVTTGTWTGNIASSGRLKAGGTITGAIDNAGVLALAGDLTAGSVSFGENAYFDVDLDTAGAGERLTVTGAAHLDGIVRIKAGSAMTSGDYLTPYVILTASTLDDTRFDDVTTDLAFLTPYLDYTGTTASVTLQRNAQDFAAIASTGNQRAVAAQVDALGQGNALHDAILWLTPEEAQAAFDQLSGEIYASAGAAAANNATLVGDLALDRLERTLGKLDGRGSANGYAAGPIGEGDGSGRSGLWTQLYGIHGTTDGGGGTSAVAGSTGGVAVGLDGLLGDWRVGVMLDAGSSRSDVAALDSSVLSTDYGLGVYGGTRWGDTQLTLAGSYTRHDNASSRSVDFSGHTEELSADYGANTLQIGGKLSHEFDLGALSFVPYASAAYVNHATDDFSETGGAAALTYEAGTTETAAATLGATVGYQMLVGDGMLLTGSASLGWRHGFAETPTASVALPGGTPVTISGSGVSGDLAVLGAGLNLDVSDTMALDLNYDGRIGTGSQAHALTGTWTSNF